VRKLDTVIHKNESHRLKKLVPNTDNFIFAGLYYYNFIPVIDTTVQSNDSENSLHFKPMGLIFMNYSV
jgi:hypothetical protein